MDVKELINKERYDLSDLRAVFALLRGENGCPWDMIQTHETIRANLIEETYEVVEAIDKNDLKLMREELGDLLLQVVFHAGIEEEQGSFTLDDVISDVTDKLVRRHPHVFGDVSADDAEGALNSWENAKGEEKTERRTAVDKMNAVPPSLPSLMRAQKVISKAKKDGYPAENIVKNGADLLVSLGEKMRAGTIDGISADELGKALFAISAAAQLKDADSEHELNKNTDSFIGNYPN